MSRTVVITAMCSAWPEEKTDGVELWGVNRTHTVEPRLDRVYFFDPEHLFAGDFLKDLDALDIPVYCRKPLPDIRKSIAYPKDEVVRFFNGLCYATSTVAWMLQHAIYEHCNGHPIDKLILNGMYHPRDSLEYLPAMSCMNYWIAIAQCTIKDVQCYGTTSLVWPFPWETGDYGYSRNIHGQLCAEILAAAFRACYEVPQSFMTPDGEVAAMWDYDNLIQTRDKAKALLAAAERNLETLHANQTQGATTYDADADTQPAGA